MIDFDIDFDKLLNDSSEDQKTAEEMRSDRIRRDDDQLFAHKKLHQIKAVMSMRNVDVQKYEATGFRATTVGPDGRIEPITLVFQGQRGDDIEASQLLVEMEKERQERIAEGDFSDPERPLELTGAWNVRKWKDGQGKPRRGFDLVVATWCYTNAEGEKVTEGSTPAITASTRQEEKDALIRSRAAELAVAKDQGRSGSRDDAAR